MPAVPGDNSGGSNSWLPGLVLAQGVSSRVGPREEEREMDLPEMGGNLSVYIRPANSGPGIGAPNAGAKGGKKKATKKSPKWGF